MGRKYMIKNSENLILTFEPGDMVSFMVPTGYEQWGFGKMADLDQADAEVLNLTLLLRAEGLADALGSQRICLVGWDERTYELSAMELLQRTERKKREAYKGKL